MAGDRISALQRELRAFAEDRDWDQFHTPKNLAIALAVEASELLEIFQWLSEESSESLDNRQLTSATHEIADVFIYLLRIADKLDIDIIKAASQKMALNAQKYPADRVRGDPRKSTDYP